MPPNDEAIRWLSVGFSFTALAQDLAAAYLRQCWGLWLGLLVSDDQLGFELPHISPTGGPYMALETMDHKLCHD